MSVDIGAGVGEFDCAAETIAIACADFSAETCAIIEFRVPAIWRASGDIECRSVAKITGGERAGRARIVAV